LRYIVPVTAMPMARLRRIAAHVVASEDGPSRNLSASPSAAEPPSPSPLPPHLTPLTAQQLKEFCSRGIIVVPPEQQDRKSVV
jgi:hypothetical protein